MKILKILIFLLYLLLFSCTKNTDDITDVIPQDIVMNDTSGITGKLLVELYYIDNGKLMDADGAVVSLYVSREDMYADTLGSNTDFSIYSVKVVNSNVVDFGFLNYGNYYLYASLDYNNRYYSKEAVVQVYAQREVVRRVILE